MQAAVNMGLASNERKEQDIMRLRRAFNRQKVVTVKSAMLLFGYSRNTIIRWAKSGKIPLIDEKSGKSVTKLTRENTPRWWKI